MICYLELKSMDCQLIESIYLLQGVDYLNRDEYKQSLFKSFCLPSWTTHNYKVSVLTEVTDGTGLVRVRLFASLNNREQSKGYLLHEERSNPSVNGQYCINYRIQQVPDKNIPKSEVHQRMLSFWKMRESGRAQFRDQGDNLRVDIFMGKQMLTIFQELAELVTLSSTYINQSPRNSFWQPTKQSQASELRRGDIQYYYIEASDSRYYQPEGYHFNLAMQGGGAKGISYVGAYEALEEFQKRIEVPVPVRSVIGSSAGSILALGISASMPPKEIKFMCLLLDTVFEDLLIETWSEAQEAEKDPSQSGHFLQNENRSQPYQPLHSVREQSIELNEEKISFNQKNKTDLQSGFFSEQLQHLKQLLHSFGILEDKHSQNLIETLSNPYIQDKVITYLQEVSPAAASMLTFKPNYRGESPLQQGQQDKCCCGMCQCCRQQKSDCRVLNLYGLAFGGLLSGQGFEDVLNYALVVFLEKYVTDNQNNPPQLAVLRAIIEQRTFIKISRKDEEMVQQIHRLAGEIKEEYIKHSDLTHPQDPSKKRRFLRREIKYINLPLMHLVKTITLQEYYSLTKVQFTCTSADMDDKIIRFFNHKTTPHLPVCKAIRMSGSFPVAYYPLSWQSEWGPYYIHYKLTRRQISLTGHRFTDGGLLANFPLEYLDNQKFRPMYFSHQQVPGKTLMYGLGSQQLPAFPEQAVSPRAQVLKDELSKQFGSAMMRKSLWSWFCCCICGAVKAQKRQEIKLRFVELAINLLMVFRDCNRNINKECFRDELIVMPIWIPQKINAQRLGVAENKKSGNQSASRLFQRSSGNNKSNFLLTFEKAQSQVQKHFPKHDGQHYNPESISRFLSVQFNVLRQKVTHGSQAENSLITSQVMTELIDMIKGNMDGIFKPAVRVYQQFMREYSQNYLFLSSARDLKKKLLGLINQMDKEVRSFMLNQHYKRVSLLIEPSKKLADHFFEEHAVIIRDNVEELIDSKSYNEYSNVLNLNIDTVKKIINSKKELTPSMFGIIEDIKAKIDAPIVAVKFLAEDNFSTRIEGIKNSITRSLNQKIFNYVQMKLKQHQKHVWVTSEHNSHKKQSLTIKPRLHVVLQSMWTAHFYYCNYFKVLESVLHSINVLQHIKHQDTWKNIRIGVITATDYHAIFPVMYALGMPLDQISEQVTSVHKLFRPYERIQEIFQSQDWMQSSLDKAKKHLRSAWNSRYDAFSHFQKTYDEEKESQEFTELNPSVQNKISISEQEFGQAFDRVLNYVSGSYEQLKSMKKSERKSRFIELMSLDPSKRGNSKHLKYMVQQFMSYAGQLLMVFCYIFMSEQDYVNLGAKEYPPDVIIKGLLVQRLACSIDYKEFIFDLLKKHKLSHHVTLKNFYDSSDTKILLNFSCFNTKNQRFTLINKKTRPNMPLWAALMAAASFPHLEGDFNSRREWEENEIAEKIHNRPAFEQFKNEQVHGQSKNKTYFSGNCLSSLPIDLLTNHKLIKKYLVDEQYQTEDHIELVFSFEPQPSLLKGQHQTKSSLQEDVQLQKHIKTQITYGIRQGINSIASFMEGRTTFPGLCDLIRYGCRSLFGCCDVGNLGDYLSGLAGDFQLIKMLLIRVVAHDNLVSHLYENELIKLPVRLGTLDFHKVSRFNPLASDCFRQDKEVMRDILNNIHYDQKQEKIVQYQQNPSLTVQMYQVRRLQHDESKPREIRIKFISLSKWRKINYRYRVSVIFPLEDREDIIESELSSNQMYQIDTDHIDLIVPQSYAYLKFGIKIISLSPGLKVQSRIIQLTLSEKMLSLMENVAQDHWRCVFRLGQGSIYKNEQIPVQWVNFSSKKQLQLTNFPQTLTAISRFLPRCAPFCLNPKCPQTLSHLSVSNFHSQAQASKQSICRLCSQRRVIAMFCTYCGCQYCFKCKLRNFVVKDRHLGGQTSQIIISPNFLQRLSAILAIKQQKSVTTKYTEAVESFEISRSGDQGHIISTKKNEIVQPDWMRMTEILHSRDYELEWSVCLVCGKYQDNLTVLKVKDDDLFKIVKQITVCDACALDVPEYSS